MKKVGLVVGTVLTSMGVLFYFGCANSNGIGTSSSSSSSSGTYSYAGPGSHYTITNSSGTYTIKKYTTPLSTSTDFAVTATSTDTYGFKKLSITSSSGSNGPAVGSTAYGLEVPGFAMFIQPINSSYPDQAVVGVASGSCPTATLSANWVMVKNPSDVSSSSVNTFGVFQFVPSSGTTGVASLTASYSLANTSTSLGTQTFNSATCSNGLLTVVSNNDTAAMYLTANGGAIINTSINNDANNQFILGFPIYSITGSALTGTYSGFMYMGGGTSGSRLKLVKFSVTGATSTVTGTGSLLADPSTDTTQTGTANFSITSINSPSTGLMTGTLTTGSGTANLACMAVNNANGSGKNIINCAGSDPQSTSKLFNFLLVSR